MLQKNSEDRRVQRTKKAIRNAFAELLVEKEVGDITVREIAELADINRKTFYNYYAGVHEVVDELENEVVSSFEAVLENVDWVQAIESPYTVFARVTAVISTDIDFYAHLFTMTGNSSLTNKLVRLIKEKIRSALGDRVSADERAADTALVYTLNGMLSAYQSWFSADRQQTLEELTETISVLCFHGLSGLISTD